MRNKVLTPLQLWADYDAARHSCAVSFTHYKTVDNRTVFSAYVSGEQVGDETIRIFVRGEMPKGGSDNVVVYVGDAMYSGDYLSMAELVEDGFCVVAFDYCGRVEGKTDYTRYPADLAYCNYMQAGDHLTKAIPTAKETCIFTWAKVCRSVIGFAKQMCGADCKLFLAGIRSGASIMWQAGAMDKRVDGLIGVLHAGWKEYVGVPKYSDILFDMTDERERWLMGCSAQTYAKFISVPTLFVGSTNNTESSFDRIENTLGILRERVPVSQSICAGLTNTIDSAGISTIRHWIASQTSKSVVMPANPSVSVSIQDRAVVATVQPDASEEIAQIDIYYNFDEVQSDLRSWKPLRVSVANPKEQIPVYTGNRLLFVHASVLYKKGYRLSTLPVVTHLDPEHLDVRTDVRKRPVIYERKDGIASWVAENEDRYSAYIMPRMAVGALDIQGITAERGNLSTYLIGEISPRMADQKLLQFDAYAATDRACHVVVCVDEGAGKHRNYTASATIAGGAWNKVSLEVQSFKSDDFMTLKSWQKVKKLTFMQADGILFNNILWV